MEAWQWDAIKVLLAVIIIPLVLAVRNRDMKEIAGVKALCEEQKERMHAIEVLLPERYATRDSVQGVSERLGENVSELHAKIDVIEGRAQQRHNDLMILLVGRAGAK